MPAIRLNSCDLLEYNAKYSVLICRECQYAIQKSALRSHLLRHKIYRDERKKLLSFIAQFDLLEPHQVSLPIPGSPPIDALPIISGFRCRGTGCGNLCASLKRMRRHRSEAHGYRDPPNRSSFAQPVKIQTFFRGTKLRYFEVASSPAAGTAGRTPLATTSDGDEDGRSDGEGREMDTGMSPPLPLPPRRQHVPSPPETPPDSSPIALDLETLTYFHHFTTITSLTLPNTEQPQSATSYWQTDVVSQTLQRRWLMCGLLALSAYHLAVLTRDSDVERTHRERAARFCSEFFAGWEEMVKYDEDVVADGVDEKARKAGGNIRCLLRCMHWASDGSTLDRGLPSDPEAPSQLLSIMDIIRSFSITDHVLQSAEISTDGDDNPHENESSTQTFRTLHTNNPSNPPSPPLPNSSNTPSTPFSFSALLTCLHALPTHMAVIFGKPLTAQDTQDVLATLSAILGLIKCCDAISSSTYNFTSSNVSTSDSVSTADDLGAARQGIATRHTGAPWQPTPASQPTAQWQATSDKIPAPWQTTPPWHALSIGQALATFPTALPAHFTTMLTRPTPSPAALVVLAHWAVLVQFAEEYGCWCWFLRGAARRIVLLVREGLDGERMAVRGLAEGVWWDDGLVD